MRLPWKLVSRETWEIVCQLATDHLEGEILTEAISLDELLDEIEAEKPEGELVDRAMRWEPGDYYTYCLSCETARYIDASELRDYECDCRDMG